MRIIPAIDIIDGKCVRLSAGDYRRVSTYADDPLEVARKFQGQGARFLHLVDLDGARSGAVQHWDVLERIVSGTELAVDFGGGLRTRDDLERAFAYGASQVNIGSLAVRERETVLAWLADFGPERIVLGADARAGKIAMDGWSRESDCDVTQFVAEYHAAGMKYVACTDVSRDGMLNGPALGLYEELVESVSGLRLIASGGITTVDDILELRRIGLDGAIVGKSLYEGKLTLKAIADLPGGLD